MQPTRRQALAASAVLLAAATATACTSDEPPGPPARTPDDALREAAVAREQALVDAYTAALQAHPQDAPRLAHLLGDHSAHLARLGPVVGASASPRPPARALSLRALASRERAAAAAHGAAALTASRELASLLASLAACEASHAAVL
ncbi:MAG TPA: hypothetical protein VM097_10810 [Mycobacteriales bacterium]|nr:hypothetical protein [Mycobacteriales bacterium]